MKNATISHKFIGELRIEQERICDTCISYSVMDGYCCEDGDYHHGYEDACGDWKDFESKQPKLNEFTSFRELLNDMLKSQKRKERTNAKKE